MANQKLYFRSIDDTFCEPIDGILAEAKYEGREKVTVLEAIRDRETKEYVWCTHFGEVTERSECVKSCCSSYEPNKSGRGTCSNRGKLYRHGDEGTFDVKSGKETNHDS